MAHEYDEMEFVLWLDLLKKENSVLEQLLKEENIDTEKIRMSRRLVCMQLEEILRLKPKKPQHYDYKPAIPLLVEAKILISKTEAVIPEEKPAPTETPSQSNQSRRIPDITVPTFDGDIVKYSSFVAIFHMKYDKLPIEDAERLQQLKECCDGIPRNLIDRYELKNENYPLALKQLQDAFASNEDVISTLYSRLRALPRATNNNNSLQSTYYELESLLGALEAHGQKLDSFPPLRDDVYYKYPEWLTYQACGKQRLPISQFQKEVGEHLKIRLARSNSDPQHQKAQNAMNTAAFATTKDIAVSPWPPEYDDNAGDSTVEQITGYTAVAKDDEYG